VKPTAVSLFAGVGGIDLALERAGFDVVAAVEIDKAARGVIADRMPSTTLFDDVTKVSADDLRAAGFVPDRGLLAAGWPCQGNSVAGRRGGLADPRSGLWSHVVRLLGDLTPRWFLGENVPGLLSVTEGEDFSIILDQLAGCGYGFAWRVLDAQRFGLPQRRRRVFIAGRAGDNGTAPARVLLEPEGGGWDLAASTPPRPRPARRAARGSGAPGVAATVSTLQGGGKRGYRIDAEGAAGGHIIPQTFEKIIRFVSETTIRRLTPLEWERLQGFPDGWTVMSNGKPQADSARYRQMGNAVAVPCVEWIARRIAAVDGAT
jgi:DNA (cytosine-5)-methyltransferase 1